MDDETVVEACNCPSAEVVDATHLPCTSEECFYEALFDRAERTRHMPDGDAVCAYELPVLRP